MTINYLDYYRNQSDISNPGKFEYLFEDLPGFDIPELINIIQNNMIHFFWIHDKKNYGVSLEEFKKTGRKLNDEINLRSMEEILGRIIEIEDINLVEDRTPINRVLGNCRDYALFLTSIMRYFYIPARVRSGSALYFYPGEIKFEDHYVCEYWNENKWCYSDPQLDELMKKTCKINFDTNNFSKEHFLNAGETYTEFHKKQHPPENFGIQDWTGELFVRNKLIMDLASINKVEVLAWERWGTCAKFNNEVNEEDVVLFEKVAKLLSKDDNASFKEGKEMFETQKGLKMPENYKPFRLEFPFLKS